MNEQTQNNRQKSQFLKIFIQNPKSESFKPIPITLSGSDTQVQVRMANSTQNPSQIVIFL